MAYREPGKIIRDILISEMELKDSQVRFTNQKFNIPTKGLLIVLSYVGPSKSISNMNEWENDGAEGLIEVQSVTMLHLVQIDILGYGYDVRTRKEEMILALRSVFSQQQQELYQMQIARMPSGLLDTSFLEETKICTRYTMTIITTSLLQKRKTIDSYAAFHTQAFSEVSPVPFADFEAQEKPQFEG